MYVNKSRKNTLIHFCFYLQGLQQNLNDREKHSQKGVTLQFFVEEKFVFSNTFILFEMPFIRKFW